MGPLPKIRIKRIEKIGVEELYSYFPARNSLLLNQRWKCVKPRLTNLGFYGTRKRLLKWAKWTEVIAQDVTNTWGIFRGGGGCHTTKPNLYLMRMDGTLLLRELPKGKFMRLRSLPPSQIAVCN